MPTRGNTAHRAVRDAAEKNGGFLLRMETKAVHAGRGVDPATGAVTPPIHLSTTFERDADGGYPRGYEYTRESNPNRDALEECVRELEGGAAAAAFSSGMAATMTVLQTLAPGDHVVAPDDTYFGTREIFRDLFSHWGVETSFVDMTNAEEVGGAVRPSTRLFWVETPSNPRLKITDVREISGIARHAGALGERGEGRAVLGRAPRGRRGLLPGARVAPRARGSLRADVPLRWDALVPRAGGPGACDGRRCQRPGVHAGDEPRGDAQLRRAPGVHRGTGDRRPENLLRLSVGLEHPDDLTEDLARALGPAKR